MIFKLECDNSSMAIERMTAVKARISDLTGGRFVRKDGLEPSFVLTENGQRISRARILGTIVGRFIADDGNFASVTIDDSTDTIRAKTFKTVKPLDKAEIGDMVDIIGKVKEYNDEIYIIPEIVRKIQDPNFELLRVLEIIKQRKRKGKSETKVPEPEEKDMLRKRVLEFIESEKEGVEYSKLLETIKGEENQIESIVNELLAEGICYEPTPGRIKKI